MPSVKYLQLILMNLTVAGLSSSEFGESSRRMDFADMQFDMPSSRKLKSQIRGLNVMFVLSIACISIIIMWFQFSLDFDFMPPEPDIRPEVIFFSWLPKSW